VCSSTCDHTGACVPVERHAYTNKCAPRGYYQSYAANTRVNKFGEFYRNSTDSIPSNFKIGDFTVHRFKIFKNKKYV
jgi:hypothetical protein